MVKAKKMPIPFMSIFVTNLLNILQIFNKHISYF